MPVAAPADLLVTDALLVETEPDPRVVPGAWFAVRDGVVTARGTGPVPSGVTVGPGTERLDAAGAFVAPGFVSGHSHTFTSGSRGLGVGERLYGWAEAMYAVTLDAGPDDVYWCVLHGALDHVVSGTTTVFDFTDPRTTWQPMAAGRRARPADTVRGTDWLTRQLDARMDSGIRFVGAYQIEQDTFGADTGTRVFGDMVADLRSRDRAFALDAAVYGAVQWSADASSARLEARMMREHGLRNHAHLLETPDQLTEQLAKVAWYVEAGAIGPDFTFGHFVQATADIVELAAERGAGVSWQPAANGRLGSGVLDVPELLRRGITLGMGLDDQACSDLSNPWQNMRLGLYGARATWRDPAAVSPADVLRAHTLGAAETMGVADRVGSLSVGKYADFLVVDPRRPDIGPLWSPLDNYVLSCDLRNLREVRIGGRLAARDGVATAPLAARASDELHARFDAAAGGRG
ncbi:amidohydrolase family protein [Streptomyces sp. NPDC047000]|uniref:amidohydrolase family protein n=1 Tax=Streptomyces sp. NPDC047000 TaxID=3155474 RepID=UPI0033E9E9E2